MKLQAKDEQAGRLFNTATLRLTVYRKTIIMGWLFFDIRRRRGFHLRQGLGGRDGGVQGPKLGKLRNEANDS
jgi:hypothetical protein